jgi:hypothetical protein
LQCRSWRKLRAGGGRYASHGGRVYRSRRRIPLPLE